MNLYLKEGRSDILFKRPIMNKNFALGGKNLMWIGIGVVFVLVGFLLMMGAPSTEEAYNPDIFSVRRIVIAPTVAFVGFVVVIYGILRKPGKAGVTEESNKEIETETVGVSTKK